MSVNGHVAARVRRSLYPRVMYPGQWQALQAQEMLQRQYALQAQAMQKEAQQRQSDAEQQANALEKEREEYVAMLLLASYWGSQQ